MHRERLRSMLIFVLAVMLVGVWGRAGHCRDSWSPAMASMEAQGKVDITTAIIQVAKDHIPAVVHIEVTERREVANPLAPFQQNPFFRHFFNLPKNMPKKFERKIMGIGSGMLIDKRGYILTNNHVVGGATKIVVSTSDGNSYSAEVVGTDPPSDLAVIKISGSEPFPYVTFGHSDNVEVGQWVVAIGQPEGLEESVTQGIISAKHRTGITSPTSYQDFLQTDAPINPGNSGGPLMTLSGNVIGINSAILSESGGFMGIGFAIPSKMAIHVAQQLIEKGKVVRGWLGVAVQDVTPDIAKSLNLKKPEGALVADVVKGGPAGQAGIKRGDVILQYQGEPVNDASTLRNAVSNTAPGTKASVTVWRDGEKKEMTVVIGNLEEAQKKMVSSAEDRLGVKISPVTQQEMQQYGLSKQVGVMVKEVDPKGPLGREGLEPGDLILGIDNREISGPDEFASIVESLPHNQQATFMVLDHRTGRTALLKAQIP